MKGIIEEYGCYENLPNNHKLAICKIWFDSYFDKQLIQSQWQEDFKVSHDKIFNKDYADINELKAQANFVRNKIKELEASL